MYIFKFHIYIYLFILIIAFFFFFVIWLLANFLEFTFLGRAGVPLEVMGLMLGEFVDDYSIKVVDVFAMPQSGTGVQYFF